MARSTLRWLAGLTVLAVTSCDLSTPCGAGHRQAKNDRNGAAITYCVAQDGRADGAYSCRLHGDNGAVTGTFSFNKMHGTWSYFAEDETLVRTETWKDGELLDTRVAFKGKHAPLQCDDHVIFAEPSVLPDVDVGWSHEGKKTTRWYPDADPKQPWASGEYVDGLKSGPWTYWYPDGSVRGTGRYDHGLVDGEWVMLDTTGSRSVKGYYRRGRLVGGEDVQPAIIGARALHDPNSYELSDDEVRNQRLTP